MDDGKGAGAGSDGAAAVLPSTFGGAVETEAAARLRKLTDDARSAWVFGLAAVILALVSPCASSMPLLVALPLALVASTKARAVLASPDLDATTEVYGRTAQILGLATAVWSSLMLLALFTLITIYAAAFIAAFASLQ